MSVEQRRRIRSWFFTGVGLTLLVLLVSGCNWRDLSVGSKEANPQANKRAVAGQTPPRLPPGPPEKVAEMLHLAATGEAYEGPGVEMRFICLDCHIVQTPTIVTDWNESKMGQAGVKCYACHGTHDRDFVLQPGPERCQACHPLEVQGYRDSKHSWVKNMKAPSCKSCHPMHTFSLAVAKNAIICTQCHLDIQHVQLYPQSKMGSIFRTLGEGTAAYCVTCHKPKMAAEFGIPANGHVANHNVTASRNREKMVQVCLDCHSERSARDKLLGSELWKRQWLGDGPK